MTLEITGDTDTSDIRGAIGREADRASIREADARRTRLQRNIQRQARNWDTTVNLDPDHDTAHVEANPDSGPEVVITAREVEQPVTDYEGRVWDWMVQRSFGVHEVGHIRYTAMEDVQDRLKDIESAGRGTAKALQNAAEDGAIEQQITRRWPNYYEPLRALRANLFEDNEPGIADPEKGGYIYPLSHAAQAATMDLWMREVYDIDLGVVTALRDDTDISRHFANEGDYHIFWDKVFPEVEALVEAALTTPGPLKRNELMFERIENILDIIPEAEADGQSHMNGNSGGEDDGSGMPNDADNHHDRSDAKDAKELSGTVEVTSADDSDDLGDPVDVDLTDVDEVIVDDDLEAEARTQVADDEMEEAGLNDSQVEELEEMADVIGSNAEDLNHGSIIYPTHNWEADRRRFNEAEKASKSLAQILRQRLQSEKRTETQRNRRRGRLDSSALHRTKTGETRVKMRKNEPDEKDYNAVVVLDRSGSMSGKAIEQAEVSTGMLMLGLEAVGVDTMQVELYGTDLRLAKPFGTGTDDRPGKVFHGETKGGTPLTQCLQLSRARLNKKGGNRFMVVVTDGRPSKPQEFQQVVQSCSFPVIGVTIGTQSDVNGSVYHREAEATPGDDLASTLRELCHEVMF